MVCYTTSQGYMEYPHGVGHIFYVMECMLRVDRALYMINVFIVWLHYRRVYQAHDLKKVLL